MKQSIWEFWKVEKGKQIQEAVGVLHNEVFIFKNFLTFKSHFDILALEIVYFNSVGCVGFWNGLYSCVFLEDYLCRTHIGYTYLLCMKYLKI